MRQNKKIKTFSVFALLTFFSLSPVLAADFDPNDVISENDLTAEQSMNLTQIQDFLAKQEGTLDEYTCLAQGKDQDGNDIPEKDITAAQAFYEVSRRWGISPKFLLVLVQKEQSLVTHPEPSDSRYDWATGYAVCDSCSLDDPAIQRWKGFYKQINSAAAQFDYYLENPDEFYFKSGQTYIIDGQEVTPENDATAAMYNYTPHLHGNRNFVNIWNEWFGEGGNTEEEYDYPYPDGSLVQVSGEAGVWYIQFGTRRPIQSKAAMVTRFDPARIIAINRADLEVYPKGWPIALANYSLVRSPRGQVFLIDGDEKRPILSDEIFKKIGWNPDEVEDASDAELANFFEGSPINEDSLYPQGVLAQDQASGGIYFVQDGAKTPIWSKEIMTVNYPNKKLIGLTPEELDKYETLEPALFKDGTLVKSDRFPEVYVVSNGKLRWIPDESTFVTKGYQWQNIVVTSYKALSLHPLGEILI